MAPKEPKLENRQGKALGSGTTSQARKERRAKLQADAIFPPAGNQPATYTPAQWSDPQWYGWSSSSSGWGGRSSSSNVWNQQVPQPVPQPVQQPVPLKKETLEKEPLKKGGSAKITSQWQGPIPKAPFQVSEPIQALHTLEKVATDIRREWSEDEESNQGVVELKEAPQVAQEGTLIQEVDYSPDDEGTSLKKESDDGPSLKKEDDVTALQKEDDEKSEGHPKDRSSQSETLQVNAPVIEGDNAIFGKSVQKVDIEKTSSSSSEDSSSSSDEQDAESRGSTKAAKKAAKCPAQGKAMPKPKDTLKREAETDGDWPALKKGSGAKGSSSAAAAHTWKRAPPVMVACWDRTFANPDPYHIGMDWHKCLEEGGWVPPEHVAMLHELWDKGFKISLCSYMGKSWTTSWYQEVLALPYVSKFAGIHDTQQRDGTRGKCYLYKTLGIKIAVDDSAEIMKECLERGLDVYPVQTKWEKHQWYYDEGFRPYQNFLDACRAIMFNTRVMRR